MSNAVHLIEGIEEYERSYLKREKTLGQVLDELAEKGHKISKSQWWNHINNYVKPKVNQYLANTNTAVISQDVIDKIGECMEGLDRLREVIEQTKTSLNSDVDPNVMKVYISAEAEFRRYIETLAKLQGEFKDVAKVQINNLNIEYNNVVGQVLQDACPNCRIKFAKTLEPLIKKQE